MTVDHHFEEGKYLLPYKNKYVRMRKYGVPERAVRDCMLMDGFAEDDIPVLTAWFEYFDQHVSGSALSANDVSGVSDARHDNRHDSRHARGLGLCGDRGASDIGIIPLPQSGNVFRSQQCLTDERLCNGGASGVDDNPRYDNNEDNRKRASVSVSNAVDFAASCVDRVTVLSKRILFGIFRKGGGTRPEKSDDSDSTSTHVHEQENHEKKENSFRVPPPYIAPSLEEINEARKKLKRIAPEKKETCR